MSSRNCIVYPCKRRGGFRLPLDSEMKLKWLEAIRWPIIPIEPKKTAIVCPTHFTECDFSEVEEGKKILKENVIPSVFPWNSNLWSKDEMEETAALKSPSTTDEEEVEKVDVDGEHSSESEIEIESLSSSNEESLEGQADEILAPEVVADEIVTISSDDDDVLSHTTSGDPESSPTTVWESSPACRETVKRSAPSNSMDSGSPEKRRRLKKRQYDIIFTTSRSSSSSSSEEEPSEKSEAKPEVPTMKNEDGADSDDSDCILCEKPIESIDLTKDDRIPEPSPDGSPPRILFDESDSGDDDLSDEATSILESSPSVLSKELCHVEPISESDAEEEVLMKKASSSEDSDCEIIERIPPTIEIYSDDEGTKNHGGDQEEVDPFAGITNGENDPLPDAPDVPADPLSGDVARGPIDSTSPSVPSPSGNMSHVASKDPNAPLIQKNPPVKKTARFLCNSIEKEVAKMKVERYISLSELPRDYEIVGIHPTSKTLRIVLAKKKAPKPDVPEKLEVSVNPLTACLHEVPTPIHKKHTDRSISQVMSTGKIKNVYPVTRRDLVTEESQLQSVILYRDESGFGPHCDALSRKLVDIIRKSQVMAGRLSQETILSMYNLLFLTEISYGIIYWGHCEGAHNIFDLQKRFVGMMAHKGKVEMKASRATFCVNGILTLPSIYILHCLIHVHKNLDAVKRRVAQSLRLDFTSEKELNMANREVPTFEVQGLEFYTALPPHLHAPHCSTPKFIYTMRKFLRQNGLFNALEYYDMVNTIPKYIKK